MSLEDLAERAGISHKRLEQIKSWYELAAAAECHRISDALGYTCKDCRAPEQILPAASRCYFCLKEIAKIIEASCKTCGASRWWRLRRPKRWHCGQCEPPQHPYPVRYSPED